MTRPPSGRHRANPLFHLAKATTYYESPREDAVAAILDARIRPRRVLELGCATGAFARKLQETLPLECYVGIEVVEDAARTAAPHMHRVIVGDVEQTAPENFPLQPNAFDLLVALDVLEHLRNPWDVLAELLEFIEPGGHALISIPNVQNVTLISDLVEGRWQYQSQGPLDATHVRFFTWSSIVELLAGAGLNIVHTCTILLPRLDVSGLLEQGNTVRWGRLQVSDLTREEVLRLFANTYLVVARKGEPPPAG